MPRSNRPRGRRGSSPDDDDSQLDLDRLRYGLRRVEQKADGAWNTQAHSGATADDKTYTCPGCSLEIAPGTPHTVAWRADGLFGEQRDLEARRHWHTRCWRIRR